MGLAIWITLVLSSKLTWSLADAQVKILHQEPYRCQVVAADVISCEAPFPKLPDVTVGEVTREDGYDDMYFVSHGTRCLLRVEVDQLNTFICHFSHWKMVVDSSQPRLLRTRRWTYDVTAQVSVQSSNTSPNITCPSISTPVYPEKGKVTTIVTWQPATAHDQEDGDLNVTQTLGKPPGTEHGEGTYTIAYIARDSQGLADICSRTFTVSVQRCPHESTYILNGTVTCQPQNHVNIVGSQCSFICQTGYQLLGNSTLHCLEQGHWSSEKPKCVGISCDPPAQVEHGMFVCQTNQHTYLSQCVLACDTGYSVMGQDKIITCHMNGRWSSAVKCEVKHCQAFDAPANADMTCSHDNQYGSMCTITCHNLYILEGNGSRVCQDNQTWTGEQPQCIKKCAEPQKVPHGHYECPDGHHYKASCSLVCDIGYKPTSQLNITCNDDTKWTNAGTCQDIEPPQFVDDCPLDIKQVTLGQSKVINYTIPEARDNSGERVTVTGNPSSDASFDVGVTTVHITATDSQGNKVTCQFNVTVTVLMCRDPNLGIWSSDPIHYKCPDGFGYGKSCSASCANGTMLRGSTGITCLKSNDFDAVEWGPSSDTDVYYCQDLCTPGYYSSNGHQPCTICPQGSYQSEYGQTDYSFCPYGMMTLVSGSVSKEDCQFFDLFLSPNFPKPIIQLPEYRPRAFSIVLWLYLNAYSPKTRLIITVNPTEVRTGALYINLDLFGIYIIPEEDENLRSINYWYHLVFVYDRGEQDLGTAKLYVNGQVLGSVDNLSPSNLSQKTISYGIQGSIILFVLNPLTVTRPEMSDTALTQAEVLDLYHSCDKHLPKNLFATDLLFSFKTLSTCDASDSCIGAPCGQHGTCIDGQGQFSCLCDEHWSGKRCQIPDDFCPGHSCANGATCVSDSQSYNYTCVCAQGFKGALCQDKIKNGSWSTWGNWSVCSVPCGLGQRSRVRQCNNPQPDPEGQGCLGEAHQMQECLGSQCPVNGGLGEWSEWSPCSVTCGGGSSSRKRACDNPAPVNGGTTCDPVHTEGSVRCNEVPCPECPDLVQRSDQQLINCTYTTDKSLRVCSITCSPGLAVVPDSATTFDCGYLTNYTWSHQTDKNPTALLPACTDQRRPDNATARIDFVFQNDTCQNALPNAILTEAIKKTVLNKLTCKTETDCNSIVTINSTCASGLMQGTINIQLGTMKDTSSKHFSTLSEEERHAELTQALKFMQLSNISLEVLDASVGGQGQKVNMTLTQMLIQCHEGSGLYGGLCADCPPGSYSTGKGSCELCKTGFFQDKNKTTTCHPCPKCFTTAGEGAFSSTECNINICSPGPTTTNQPIEPPPPVIIPVVAGVGGALILTAVLMWVVIRHYRKNTGVSHPYDIPGQTEERDHDPYDTVPDDVYDQIQDDPYTSAQDLLPERSDGYIKPADGHFASNEGYGIINNRILPESSDGYIKPADGHFASNEGYGIINRIYNQNDDGAANLPFRNESEMSVNQKLPSTNDEKDPASQQAGCSPVNFGASASGYLGSTSSNSANINVHNEGSTNSYFDQIGFEERDVQLSDSESHALNSSSPSVTVLPLSE